MPWSHRWIGTPVLTCVLNRFFGAHISDANCGMPQASRKDAIERLNLEEPDGMEFASEMVRCGPRSAGSHRRDADRLLPQPA